MTRNSATRSLRILVAGGGVAFLRIYLWPSGDDGLPREDGLQAAWDDADEQRKDFQDLVLRIADQLRPPPESRCEGQPTA
ncbi:hypothetical protein [Dactylosporangium sp. CA-233914]|uniref:hypothetical protein n=1 Tax=Dactylosporangium sp. CA-233914 TaxID=3239934 RepID=UPI003D8C88EE